MYGAPREPLRMACSCDIVSLHVSGQLHKDPLGRSAAGASSLLCHIHPSWIGTGHAWICFKWYSTMKTLVVVLTNLTYFLGITYARSAAAFLTAFRLYTLTCVLCKANVHTYNTVCVLEWPTARWKKRTPVCFQKSDHTGSMICLPTLSTMK